MNMIDTTFGVSPRVLALRSQRSALIAANLANADTPHYKARDIDFGRALANAAGDAPGTLRRTSERHLGLEGGTGSSSSSSAIAGELRYRIPAQPSLDGNTVETDREHAAFMDNAIRYQASLNFLNGRIQGLRGE